jgi:hypothetical protein
LPRLATSVLEPVLKLAVEIFLGVPSPRGSKRFAPKRFESFVDQARLRLIGRRPVAVAATEHDIIDALGGAWLCLVQPLDELCAALSGGAPL